MGRGPSLARPPRTATRPRRTLLPAHALLEGGPRYRILTFLVVGAHRLPASLAAATGWRSTAELEVKETRSANDLVGSVLSQSTDRSWTGAIPCHVGPAQNVG